MTRRFWIMIGLALVALMFGLISTTAISRAETAESPPEIPLQSHDFVDVPVATKEWMEPFINAFYHQDVTTGCNQAPLQYCPEASVTRAELAVFMGRALGYRQAEIDRYNAEAYFKQTTPGVNYHGVVARSVDGYGVYGSSTNGLGVFATSFNNWAIYGLSSNSYGVFARSTYASAFRASNDFDDVNTNNFYDIEAGGLLGEIFGIALHLFSNDNITLDLDHDNNSGSTFNVRNGADAYILTVNEAGTLHVTGNLEADGVKPATVETAHHGKRAMYAVESTEVWFEDMGRGKLRSGEVTITFDAMFAETVNLNENYEVFLTPIGGWADLYIVEMTATGFTVRAADGRSNIEFSYRVVAKRLGYEEVRMEEAGD